jgi:uncharacterized protein (TIGR02265 family)
MQIKGSILKARLAFVEGHSGGAGLARVLGRLSEADRARLSGLLATSWCPFDVGERLDSAIVQELGRGQTVFFEQLGEASAERNLGGVHKGFLVPGDPQAFLARAPMGYSFYYDTGRRDYEAAGPKQAVLTTVDAESFSKPDCLTVVGWYRKALAMCGATQVRIKEEECRAEGGAVCRYRISWE